MAGSSPTLRILLVGATGQVGHELSRSLAGLGDVVAVDRKAMDLSVPASIRAMVRAHEPQIIVNAAAYTAVDKAESEADLANTINAAAPGLLAEEANRLGAILVHYSTDYVFDGQKSTPYDEGDPVHPLSVYGATKLAGERAVVAGCRRHLVFRTSWVFANRGSNFLKTILRLASERSALTIVADQHGVPTSAALIADVTRDVLAVMLDAPATDPRWGVYHLAPRGETSWHDYAVHLVRRARERGAPLKATSDAISAITTADYPTAARRPANSRLNTARLRSTFGVDLPDWTRDVDRTVDELLPVQQTR